MADHDEIAILVCMPAETPSPFPDNLVGACDRCGRPVIYRPHAPVSVKVCVDCIDAEAKEQGAVVITAATAAELRDFWRKQQH